MTEDYLSLAREFPTIGVGKWVQAVEKILDGGDLGSLNLRTEPEIVLEPLYSSTLVPVSRVGDAPYTRGLASSGVVRRQPILTEIELAEALAGQAEALIVPAQIVSGFEGNTPVSFFLPIAQSNRDEVQEYLSALNHDHFAAGGLGLDPLGGHSEHSPFTLDALGELFADVLADHPHLRVICVSSAAFHLGGATDSQELGALLSSTAEYLRLIEHSEISPRIAAPLIEHDLQLDADLFAGVSKLRAARKVLARLLGACAADPRSIYLNGTTARRGYSRRDCEVNILRATSAVMAAQLGGANSVTVLPHDALNNEMSSRVARNIPVVLGEEAGLNKVADPAGGSWYLEERTQALAVAAWGFFQEIERNGGMASVLESGWLGEQLSLAGSARAEDVAHRRRVVVGVNEFAFIDDDCADVSEESAKESAFDRYPPGEGYERLRDAAAASEVASVDVVVLGELSQYSARLNWLTGVLGAGGIRATVLDSGSTATDVVMLCGSDPDYLEFGKAAVDRLGVRNIVLVGSVELGESVGASSSVSQGSDLLAFLEDLHLSLGVAQ